MKIKFVSGGQTGVDRAALDCAREADIPCGGWCPAGRMAEDGVIPPTYPLQEIPNGSYRDRTWQNVIDSDGTLIIYSGRISGGTAETITAAHEHHKPLLLINAADERPSNAAIQLHDFVNKQKLSCLNVAGPRASQWPEGYAFTLAILHAFYKLMSDD